ncbi:MAG: NAD(P)(+) transhydrogenase (Re/Si-specific) subunit beta [Desulfobacteraceae bacterium]|nr:MAG: NAD(P)(+) transhydrogenase (Re/Si-specific) subunit beta [Desulfobacteraceae bacterium]
MTSSLTNIFYLIASVLLIWGLKGLTHPRTAQRGNAMGAMGMFVAVLTALVTETDLHWGYIIAGVIIGGSIGTYLALKIEMTAMPQLVALFNGLGGGASLIVAAIAMLPAIDADFSAPGLLLPVAVASVVSIVIGAVTLLGSLIAFLKLQRILRKTVVLPGQQVINGVMAAAVIVCMITLIVHPSPEILWGLIALSALLGVSLVIPIGGADMPVVIAVLNSYSGLAACGAGFVLNNNVLIISGSLVGASGMVLTRIMCRAMNRSFRNVIFGISMGGKQVDQSDDIYQGKIKSTSADEIAMILESARRVVIAPGYGMAVSQAQHAVRELTNLLEGKGIEVEFAIHPVAGRMPGHMNVLLAEADISYDKLKDMDDINPTFAQTDVAIVIGANDVVNPTARKPSGSPIAGMPILDVDQAATVIVIKRSLSPGFAGIANPLFATDHTLMYFADGKKGVNEINTALKEA